MNEYSGLKGAEPISPAPDRVWRNQKKRELNDRKRKEGEEGQKEKPQRAKEPFLEKEPTDDALDDTIGYGDSKMKKRLSKKIDLVI